MHSLTLLLIPILFLSSCSIDWNDEKDAKIAELEKQVTELKNVSNPLIFERQKECLTYKSEIEKSITWINVAWTEWREKFWRDDYTHDESFNELFYSPRKNSCLYSTVVTEIQDWKNCTFFKIYDHLSWNSSELWMYLEFIKNDEWWIEDTCDYVASKNAYMNAVKEFQWE